MLFVCFIFACGICISNETSTSLPWSVEILSYHLKLELPRPSAPISELTYNGTMQMSFSVKVSTSCIAFHAAFSYVNVGDISASLGGVAIAVTLVEQRQDLIFVHFSNDFPVRSEPILDVSFGARINTNPGSGPRQDFFGFFLSKNSVEPPTVGQSSSDFIFQERRSKRRGKLGVWEGLIEQKSANSSHLPHLKRTYGHRKRHRSDCTEAPQDSNRKMFACLFQNTDHSDARTAWPVLDEYPFKAIWSFEITVPVPFEVFTNTPEIKSTYIRGGTHRVFTFEKTKIRISSYLVSIGVGEFDVSRSETVRVISPPGTADLGIMARDVALSSIKFFENLTGIPLSTITSKTDLIVFDGPLLALEVSLIIFSFFIVRVL